MTREAVGTLTELAPGTAKKVVVDGLPIAVVRQSDGSVHALGDRCSHGDISLSEGFVEDDSIECWAHGSKFDLCTGVPRNFPAFEPVPVYTVTLDGDTIFVDTETGK
ncbi:3-phenylpropionate/trans-cinnamate dioxygenase ferredoxin subunit [Microbacteriaceae bacterium MWH-Ta3]|nr:3-phenylpropionate/trans-cinnamate dioxygenase ferredoxin subunit [Microbacteriaceae bacterium MWH-Ta3]